MTPPFVIARRCEVTKQTAEAISRNTRRLPRLRLAMTKEACGVSLKVVDEYNTLRYYERIGIIEPSRSHGNIGLYLERDLGQVWRALAWGLFMVIL